MTNVKAFAHIMCQYNNESIEFLSSTVFGGDH